MDARPSPDELLRRIDAERARHARGHLKVFLGYASGVGKTRRMIDEARRRRLRGEDLVVAATQPTSDAAIAGLLSHLELIPQFPGPAPQPIDVAAVLRRRPAVCLIDGLAYSNPPGSPNQFRYQDVESLLDSGIGVLTSINVHHVAELQPQVRAINGRAPADSIPRSFLLRAGDIEIVDAPHQPGNTQLAQLRELALVLAADVVDAQLLHYLDTHGISASYGANERILVCITPRSNAELMISRGRRQADRFHGELFVAYFQQPNLSRTDRATLDINLAAARHAHAHIHILEGASFTTAVLQFAAAHLITQIFVGHSQRTGWLQRFKLNPVERLILESRNIDVRIFPQKAAHE